MDEVTKLPIVGEEQYAIIFAGQPVLINKVGFDENEEDPDEIELSIDYTPINITSQDEDGNFNYEYNDQIALSEHQESLLKEFIVQTLEKYEE